MTRPTAVRSPHGYRSSTKKWARRGDRRPDAMANQIARPAVHYDDLSLRNQRRFDAQLAAWRAGNALVIAVHLHVTYGIPVPREAVNEWQRARRNLEVFYV